MEQRPPNFPLRLDGKLREELRDYCWITKQSQNGFIAQAIINELRRVKQK